MPLPPYIASKRPPDAQDKSDYQTLFAREDGSVAAPTAGLHFTSELLARLEACGVAVHKVTLHVGAGTFLPVKSDDTEGHKMHAEFSVVTAETAAALNAARAKGGRIVAVGSTALRTLETAAGDDGQIREFAGDTAIFITPGYRFKALTDIGFHGYAIGGLAVGEPQDVMLKVVEETTPSLPAEAPRYLMGVGTPHDMLEAVARGVDMFDCVMPTRNGRHGTAFTRFGSINLANARHADDPRPLDEQSVHPDARTYSRAYLHHLTKANEILGQVVLSTINIAYYQQLMAGMREAIAGGRFADFHAVTMAGWAAGDIPPR